MFGASLKGLRISIERFLFFGVLAWGIDELGGYAIGEEMSVMAKIGGEDGRVACLNGVSIGVR